MFSKDTGAVLRALYENRLALSCLLLHQDDPSCLCRLVVDEGTVVSEALSASTVHRSHLDGEEWDPTYSVSFRLEGDCDNRRIRVEVSKGFITVEDESLSGPARLLVERRRITVASLDATLRQLKRLLRDFVNASPSRR
jgi:hypothetical protein